ncbi:MAG: hypothetical protein KJ871_06055 [Alphaproteobacteria bacterium]|nr:hypothetical protein [Alphaproteobacteria bacterium]MBU2083068.1 hypothetical protein [Alphaproteobacteria bacterium]MBU2144633.1 hypothetical protein [Alphaproteobacteria bacterium]MBU2195352.1 hypothetical protein [Alphaproteobacteria bacterium]
MTFLLLPVKNDEPALAGAPMICAAQKVLSYLAEHDAIGLTKGKAFQRKFVHWAAAEFDWPGWEEDKLFLVNKVLNEYDFPPLEALHFVLLKLKLIRHYKLTCRLTKAGRDIADKTGDLFNLMMPFWLFEVDHAASSRMPEPRLGNCDVFLGVLNTEAAQGVTCVALREILYGPPYADQPYDRMPGMIWLQVLEPLCWLGLLAETTSDERHHFEDRVYTATGLWSEAFRFPSEGQAGLMTLH